MNRVWVVSPAYDYEGLGEPLAVFSTQRKAKAWLRRYEKKSLKDGHGRELMACDFDPKVSDV
jgi:hypothetical protein